MAIRGRTNGKVVIKGELIIDQTKDPKFEGLIFDGTLTLNSATNAHFKNCTFASSGPVSLRVASSNGLMVTHSLFDGFTESGLSLENSENAFLSSNIYQNAKGTAVRQDVKSSILYSDYNGYQNPLLARRIEERNLPLSDLPEQGQDRYSRSIDEPDIVGLTGGRLGTPLGPYVEKSLAWQPVRVTPPVMHSVSTTTANFEWRTTQPAIFKVAWGTTPECESSTTLEVDNFATFSLSDLAPGQTYYFKIAEVSPPPAFPGSDFRVKGMDPKPITFETPAEDRAVKTWHVAVKGDDANTGESMDAAWKTLRQAAEKVGPGDTVIVHEGTYNESVRLKATGTKERPITFRSAPGAKVTIEGGNQTLETAFTLHDKSHIRVDGFHFSKFGLDKGISSWQITFSKGVFDIYASDDVQITRCLSDGRSGGAPFAPPFIKTYKAKDILIENCVITGGFNAMMISDTENFRLHNSVLIHPLIHAAHIEGSNIEIKNSIIADNKRSKVKTALIYVSSAESFVEANNCFLFRLPDDEKKFLKYGSWESTPVRAGLKEFYQNVGRPPSNSIVADPQFARLEGTESTGFAGDLMMGAGEMNFSDFFIKNEEVKSRNIGLNEGAFSEFWMPDPSR